MNYDLKLKISDKKLFESHDQAQGMGPSKNIAWEDALLGVSKNLYPLIKDVAFVLSEKMEIDSFKNTLQRLDGWNINAHYDIDALFAEIRKMIDSL